MIRPNAAITMRFLHFKLINLIQLTAVLSVMAAIAVSQSIVITLAAGLFLSIAASIQLRKNGVRWIGCGIISGYLFAAPFIYQMAITPILNGDVVQGQLYNEDGPLVFFLGLAIAFVLCGSCLALLGAGCGIVMDWTKPNKLD